MPLSRDGARAAQVPTGPLRTCSAGTDGAATKSSSVVKTAVNEVCGCARANMQSYQSGPRAAASGTLNSSDYWWEQP